MQSACIRVCFSVTECITPVLVNNACMYVLLGT